MLPKDTQQDDNQFPSLGEQGKNLADLLLKAAKAVSEGGDLVVGEYERNRRLDICKACDRFHASKKRCKECGCFMEAKANFRTAECPLKKW